MRELIREIKKKITESERRTLKSFSEEEEDITARFLENIKRDFEEISSNKYTIKTRIFKRKGPNSEESNFGADLIVILSIEDVDYELKKYFLAQSKKTPNQYKLKFDKRLRDQCDKMLWITSDSFIFVYTKKGIFVKSALNKGLSYKRIKNFFEDFIKCFIGEIHPIDYPHKYRYPHYPFPYPFDKDLEKLSYKTNILELNIYGEKR